MREAALPGPLETDTESLTGGLDYYGKETDRGGDLLKVVGDEGGSTVRPAGNGHGPTYIWTKYNYGKETERISQNFSG